MGGKKKFLLCVENWSLKSPQAAWPILQTYTLIVLFFRINPLFSPFPATSTQPSVFPLTQCNSDTRDTVSLGCLAAGYTPSAVTYTWRKNGVDISDFLQYPPQLKDNLYSSVSELRVPRQEWEAKPSPEYTCLVNHTDRYKQVTIRPTSKKNNFS